MAYKKIISFTLWGSKPLFTGGSIRNAQLAKELFPGWICRFHINSVPKNIIEKLSQFDNVELVNMGSDVWKEYGRRAGDAQPEGSLFWKFEPYFDEHVEVVIGRDPDNRLSHREKIAIDEWLGSGIDLKKLIDDYKKQTQWPMIDQWFLMKFIYPLVKDCSMIHHDPSCAKGCQIPTSDPLFWTDGPNSDHRMFVPRKGTNVIGKDYLEIIGIDADENDVPNAENQGKLKKWIDGGVYWWKK